MKKIKAFAKKFVIFAGVTGLVVGGLYIYFSELLTPTEYAAPEKEIVEKEVVKEVSEEEARIKAATEAAMPEIEKEAQEQYKQFVDMKKAEIRKQVRDQMIAELEQKNKEEQGEIAAY